MAFILFSSTIDACVSMPTTHLQVERILGTVSSLVCKQDVTQYKSYFNAVMQAFFFVSECMESSSLYSVICLNKTKHESDVLFNMTQAYLEKGNPSAPIRSRT